jgi:hypothetical protein
MMEELLKYEIESTTEDQFTHDSSPDVPQEKRRYHHLPLVSVCDAEESQRLGLLKTYLLSTVSYIPVNNASSLI